MSKYIKQNIASKIKNSKSGDVAIIYKYKKEGTKRVFYAPSIKDKRINSTMFARLYEAEGLVRKYFRHINSK